MIMISDTEQAINPISKRRRITQFDIDEMARLVATRKCTEKEAALMLDIKPHQWDCWKSRNKHSARFESIITRIRGAYLTTLVDRIDKAGDDKEITITDSRGNEKTITRNGDWRAKAWIAEKIDTRFQNQPASAAPQVTVQIGIIHEQLKRVIGFDDAKVIDVQPERKIKMPVRR